MSVDDSGNRIEDSPVFDTGSVDERPVLTNVSGIESVAITGRSSSTEWWRLSRFGWIVWLIVITVLAAALRLTFLDTVPSGLFFDVAANLFDGLNILAGERSIWFSRNNGREPLMIYATALSMAIVGTSVIAAKLTTALTGILSVPAMYLLGREVAATLPLGRARAVGLFAAFTTATMYWHIHFSRLGLRTIALSLFLALGSGLILAAMRKKSLILAAFGGVAIGMSFYTYTASRLVPLALLPFILTLVLTNWRDRRAIAAIATILLAFLLVIGPLGIYYWQNAALLDQRTADVSILNPSVGGGDPIRAAAKGLYRTALSIFWHGSPSALENLPSRPLFEPVTAFAFVMGLGSLFLVLVRGPSWSARFRMGFVLLLAGAMSLSPALSVNPPGFVRVSGLVPILIVIAALGLELIWHGGKKYLHRFAPIGLVGLLAIPAAWSMVDYFYFWAPSEAAYRATMQDKVEAADQIASWLDQGDRVFLAPLYARDLTFAYLLRDKPPESFDIGASVVVPATTRTRYALPVEDTSGVATIALRLGQDARFEVLSDQTGKYPLLSVITLDPSGKGSTDSPLASFEDGIALDRIELASNDVKAGETFRFTLWWRGFARPSLDYSVFIHGRDSANATRFQRDRMPGDGSVPTMRWQIGDRVGDYHEIAIPADLPAGAYRLVIGLYQLGNGQRLAIADRPDRPNELDVATLIVGR